MKFISIRDLTGKSAQVWKELPVEKEMVITSNGHPVAILAAITESNLEDSLSVFRQARAIEAVASLQRHSIEPKDGWHVYGGDGLYRLYKSEWSIWRTGRKYLIRKSYST